MPRSLSTNQIDRLGARLRIVGMIAPADRDLLERLRADHFHATAEAQRLLIEQLGLETTSRVKTVETIVDKLRRQPTLPLSRMWDIGGLRTAREMTRSQQTELRDRVILVLPDARVVDRCADPRQGYRAAHVLTTIERCRVEVQVRTRLQHLWAELMEWFAGQWGRQMRYGDPPLAPDAPVGPSGGLTRVEVYASLLRFADRIAAHEEAIDDIERAELELGEEASEDARSRLAVTRDELQAVRHELLSVFEPMIRAGLISEEA